MVLDINITGSHKQWRVLTLEGFFFYALVSLVILAAFLIIFITFQYIGESNTIDVMMIESEDQLNKEVTD